ncbi:HlyD family efflux transporter periplasmic adaptor subunit [Fulvivirga maritima]|uniref:HlyD family secretion protein n=1 Tax=Fulvivirga maritima TaxID=2904247 RepID=UPI001F28C4FE|nr:HlyD family efflux transporter periplasmic adaptor subunit [Fulvivirga maritima]UII25818.1 HlyD family efflux transporter periplasmic adaptor subunit [Fulvivirga maritima]
MSKNDDDINLRSEEVQAILTKVPNWMVLWGNVVFLTIILLLLIFSWFIKYPNVIRVEALITTQSPVNELYARSSGRLDSILVKEGGIVRKNQVIAVIENSSNYLDVIKLRSIIDTVKIKNQSFSFPIERLEDISLGDLQSSYALFENIYMQYLLSKNSYFQLDEYFSEHDHKRIQNLLSRKEDKQPEYSNHEEVDQIELQLKLLKDVIEAFDKLKRDVKEWEYTYLFKSGIKGKIVHLNYNKGSNVVKTGDLFCNIIPLDNSGYLISLKVPASELNSIEEGQLVKVHLTGYSENEYGKVTGKVISNSPMPDKEGYYEVLATLSDSKEIITTKNREINYARDLQGYAEIVTEDLRLSDRLFFKVKKILN